MASTLTLAGCGGSSSNAPEIIDPVPEPSESIQDTIIGMLNESSFSGAALVTSNGEDLLRSGFGLADSTAAIDNTADTHFRIAGVSKILTALGIIQLQRDGLITSLDLPVASFIPSIEIDQNITIRHLLTHRSGLPETAGQLAQFTFGNPETSGIQVAQQALSIIQSSDMVFEPGERSSSVTSNFLLLAYLIETLTNQSHETYIKENVLTPLSMDQTYIDNQTNNLPTETAVGNDNGEEVERRPASQYFGYADWTSTLGDLEKLGDALLNGSFLTEEEQAEFIKMPIVDNDPVGYGIVSVELTEGLYLITDGRILGYSAYFALIPESSTQIIILSNNSSWYYPSESTPEDILKLVL